jgi:hypothetical protein
MVSQGAAASHDVRRRQKTDIKAGLARQSRHQLHHRAPTSRPQTCQHLGSKHRQVWARQQTGFNIRPRRPWWTGLPSKDRRRVIDWPPWASRPPHHNNSMPPSPLRTQPDQYDPLRPEPRHSQWAETLAGGPSGPGNPLVIPRYRRVEASVEARHSNSGKRPVRGSPEGCPRGCYRAAHVYQPTSLEA